MINLPLIIAALFTFLSVLAGGFFALRFRDKMHYIMAFAAGVLLGVVSFDIFPELFEQVGKGIASPVEVMIAFVAGFLVFHLLEKTILIHHSHETDYASHTHPQVGILSAVALAAHSLVDGLSIGVAFQINQQLGVFVAAAVISHGFADGINTVTLMLSHDNAPARTKKFLLADAIAPAAGILLSTMLAIPLRALVLYLGFFAGFILYIGASDILPEAHSKHSSLKLIGLTALGTLLIFAATQLM